MARAEGKTPHRIGLLHLVGQGDPAVDLDAVNDFKKDLLSCGYREGVDIEFRDRYGNRDLARVKAYAEELVAWPADVIVSFMTNVNLTLMEATKTSRTPVVCWGTDHISAGIVESSRRPGRNFTGFSYIPYTNSARVRMLKMAVPKARKVGHLYNPNYSPAPAARKEFADDFKAMGIEMPVYEALRVEDFEPTIAAMKRDGCDAVMVGPHGLFNTNGRLLGRLFLEHRLPAFGNQVRIPETGGVGTMGPPYREGWAHMGKVVDRILKGADPAEIPIDRTRRGQTILNLKAAEILGLDLPAKLIDEADVLLDTIDA